MAAGVDKHQRRILGVFAHPDDETFCSGGTFAKYAAAGATVRVVSATPGDAGQIRDARMATRRTLGKVRAEELKRACGQLGVEDVVCLGYGDGTLSDGFHHSLVRDVTHNIRKFRPDTVITFGDDGAYGHPDHIAISVATDEAFRLAADVAHFPEQIAEGLAPHAATSLYHSYFPRNHRLLLDQLSHWLAHRDARFHGTAEFAHALMLFADESKALGYTSDHIKVAWYPAGFYMIEQGEPATSLYLILSGRAEVMRENDEGEFSKLNELGPGDFFGEEGLAFNRPRNASVVAMESVSCLVLSPGEPTGFAGRGSTSQYATYAEENSDFELASAATTCIEVIDFIPQKMAAIAAHRTQYPITPDMFPRTMIEELLGKEYYVQVYPAREMETDLRF
ncbi:MAG: PIG-L family deacetylase [Anaerolineae bacterium]